MTAAKLSPASASGHDEFLPFCRPSIEPEDIEAVVQVLQSGWITSGSKVRELEEEFRAHTGARHAVALSSATAGMHIVLHALGIGPGDEVVTPSMTWVSTVNLICLAGATPVFVDIDRDTLMADAEAIEKALTDRTRLIVPVHYAGVPLDVEALQTLSDRCGVPLVYDAAHALGSEIRGVPVGKTGTSVFSLQAIKNVTSAEGGVVCTDDDELAARLCRLRFHGLAADAFDRQTSGRLPGAEVIEPGYKYNLPDMNACLALGQLGRLAEINGRRAGLARRYMEAFSGLDAISPLGVPDYPHRHAWHLFIVRVETDRLEIDRDRFMAELKSEGIGTGLHFRPAHHHEYYRNQKYAGHASLPNTDWNAERIVTLPLFPAMDDADVDRVVESVTRIVGRFAK